MSPALLRAQPATVGQNFFKNPCTIATMFTWFATTSKKAPVEIGLKYLIIVNKRTPYNCRNSFLVNHLGKKLIQRKANG